MVCGFYFTLFIFFYRVPVRAKTNLGQQNSSRCDSCSVMRFSTVGFLVFSTFWYFPHQFPFLLINVSASAREYLRKNERIYKTSLACYSRQKDSIRKKNIQQNLWHCPFKESPIQYISICLFYLPKVLFKNIESWNPISA